MALKTRSRLLFHWRASRASLRTLHGIDAVFSRAATATGRDSAGASYTVVNGQPNWYWYDLDSDGVYETPTLRLDSDDRLYWPMLAPPQALTLYVRFIEAGTISTVGDRLLTIAAAADTDPRLAIYVTASNHYSFAHDIGATLRESEMASSPTSGQRVELRGVLKGDGSVRLHQTINEGAETSGALSATNTLQAAWSDTRLYPNSVGATNVGTQSFRDIKIIKGERTLAQCRTDF